MCPSLHHWQGDYSQWKRGISRGVIRDLLAAQRGILKRRVMLLEEMILTMCVPWGLTDCKAEKKRSFRKKTYSTVSPIENPWGLLLKSLLLLFSCFHRLWLFATPWTVACQTLLSMGFSRQEYWSALPFPSPGGLPDPGIEPMSPALQADSSPLSHCGGPTVEMQNRDLGWEAAFRMGRACAIHL